MTANNPHQTTEMTITNRIVGRVLRWTAILLVAVIARRDRPPRTGVQYLQEAPNE